MGLGFWILGALALAARDRHGNGCTAYARCTDNGCEGTHVTVCDDYTQTVDDCGELTSAVCADADRGCGCVRYSRRADCGYRTVNGHFEPGTNVHCFNQPRNCSQQSTCC